MSSSSASGNPPKQKKKGVHEKVYYKSERYCTNNYIRTEGARTYFTLDHNVTGFHALRRKALSKRGFCVTQNISSGGGGYDWRVQIYPNGHANRVGSLEVSLTPKSRQRNIDICFAIAVKDGSSQKTKTTFRRGTIDSLSESESSSGESESSSSEDDSDDSNEGAQARFKSGSQPSNISAADKLPDSFQLCITCEIPGKEVRLPLPQLYRGPKAHIDMFHQSTNTDVTLKGNSFELHAHSQFLSAFSTTFSASLNGLWTESQTKTLNVSEGISEEAMKIFLSMFYGAQIEAEDFAAMAPQLLVLSSEYNVESLGKICSQWIPNSLSPGSVVDTLLIADRYVEEFPTLKEDCLEFISMNAQAVTGHSSFSTLLEHGELVKLVLARLSKENLKKRKRDDEGFIERLIKGAKVDALRTELARRGLSTFGSAYALIERLKSAVKDS
jgi:hypothetical protein